MAEETIETRTVDEMERDRMEMIRRGMQGEFWKWFAATLQLELQQDLLDLASPDTPEDRVSYLRGMIRAKNEMLRLPGRLVALYDAEQVDSVEEEEEDLGPDTPGRRLSPVPRNLEE